MKDQSMWKGDAKKTRVTSRGTPRDSEVWPDASSQFPVRYFARQNLSNIAASSLASRTNRESSVAGFLLPLCHAVALCRTWYALRPPTHKVESRREYKITLSLSLSLYSWSFWQYYTGIREVNSKQIDPS